MLNKKKTILASALIDETDDETVYLLLTYDKKFFVIQRVVTFDGDKKTGKVDNVLYENAEYVNAIKSFTSTLYSIFPEKYFIPENMWIDSNVYTLFDLLNFMKDNNNKYPEFTQFLLDIIC